MSADNLSRLPATPEDPVISAFDCFHPNLAGFQHHEPYADEIHMYRNTSKWPPYLTKKQISQSL